MNRLLPTLAALALLAALAAPSSIASVGISPAREFAPRQVVVKFEDEARARAVRLPEGVGVRRAVANLRQRADVAYAAPNFIARASALPPSGLANDPGTIVGRASQLGGWTALQWNFLPWDAASSQGVPVSAGGIDVVGAWRNLVAAKRPGGQGTVVAVLDTGVAYRNWGKRFRRSPDFAAGQFVRGYDFVDGDALPLDENGHGTHVAGTIAEQTNNGIGLTGIAYGAKVMPVRVLDRHGSGRADAIARGIRFAVDNGAHVVNMSFNFGCGKSVPAVDQELRRAYRKGVVTVASIGNLGSEACVSPPATAPRTIGVGGSTEGGCLGAYSLSGKGVDVIAPGGGPPAPGCESVSDRPILQVTLRGGNPRRFAEPATYVGTSMAAAHVSGVVALMLATRVRKGMPKGAPGTIDPVIRRLRGTARSLGLPAARQGAGLIDAAAATAR